MNKKKNFNRRISNEDRRDDRNTFEDVKEFASSCDTVGRNQESEQSRNIPENIKDSFPLTTDQFRLAEIGDVTSSKCGNFTFSSNFSNTDSDVDSFNIRGVYAEKSETSSIPKSSRKVRHLPFKTISQETIANISKKIGKFKEVINTGHSSTSAIAGMSSKMSSKTSLLENKPSPIILPKEHFQVLQERIKAEIENLKYSECSAESKKEKKKKSEKDVEDDFDLEDLGSDIQFLPHEERERLLKKFTKLKSEEKESKSTTEVVSQSLSETEKPIVTIDLTEELDSCEVIKKTEVEAENDYPSLDLDYGSKINWDDGEKATGLKHSTLVCEKPIINLDLDESKLTVETTRKIEDIKNRLGRSLSIGLTHKEVVEKEISDESVTKSNVMSTPGSAENDAEGINEDAETLELASLRCTSERTEVIADRERRRKRRCADYPGLAFGFSIFSSDTMMKFNIIRNELHNIMNTQLKRVTENGNKSFKLKFI